MKNSKLHALYSRFLAIIFRSNWHFYVNVYECVCVRACVRAYLLVQYIIKFWIVIWCSRIYLHAKGARVSVCGCPSLCCLKTFKWNVKFSVYFLHIVIFFQVSLRIFAMQKFLMPFFSCFSLFSPVLLRFFIWHLWSHWHGTINKKNIYHIRCEYIYLLQNIVCLSICVVSV